MQSYMDRVSGLLQNAKEILVTGTTEAYNAGNGAANYIMFFY